jgi:hypothetical protein
MKIVFSFFFTLTFFLSFGQSKKKISIPKGIVYNYCDSKLVEKAKLLITNNIADSSDYSLSGKMLIVGPVLWSRFREIDRLKSIEGGNTTFLVDKNALTGKLTQDVADTQKVWSELRKEINNQSFKVRKLNEQELHFI